MEIPCCRWAHHCVPTPPERGWRDRQKDWMGRGKSNGVKIQKKTAGWSISDYFGELRQNEGRKDGMQRNLEIKSRSLVMWWNCSNVPLQPDPSLSLYVLQLLPGIQLFFSSLLSANTCHLLFPGWHFINWQNNFLANVKYPTEWGKPNGGYWDLIVYCVLSASPPPI